MHNCMEALPKDNGHTRAAQNPRVAVLLATYNGEKFLEPQIRSLAENVTPFTLHWLDDHSTDNTRTVVPSVARLAGITLVEHIRATRLGVPGVFFSLVECVEADIYLFCDQDDIWQRGKIDATVENLLPDIAEPVLCFSDPFIFRDNVPNLLYRLSDVSGVRPERALGESRLFMSGVVGGNTQGFTRPLRQTFLSHKDVAQSHAIMHDTWMYLLAMASGSVRFLADVPTTLYRMHATNASGTFASWSGGGSGRFVVTWRQYQLIRRALARQAQGFLLASATLPAGARLDRLQCVARLIASLDMRQSPVTMIHLAIRGIMWPSKRLAIGLALACICSNARI